MPQRRKPLHRKTVDSDTTPVRVVLYARVSSKDQEKEGFSISAQLRLLREYAETKQFTVAQEFVDVETAKQAGRTGFGEAIAFLKKHSATCRVLLVEKTDRLYRNIKDWVTVDELDIEVHLVKENVVLSRDSRSSEKFMHGIKVLMAKNYIDNLAEETRKGLTEKAKQGIWPTIAPFGYRNVLGPEGKKIIEPNPEFAQHITHLFERYATGNHSLKEITQIAKTDGMRLSRTSRSIQKSTVHRILRNRVYTGDFEWDGKIYQGIHTPLVTRELWEKVQEILEGRYIKRHHKVKYDFAFSRLISCGHCGCSLVGEIKKQRYIYYHCTGYKMKCPDPYTREELLEERFTDLLKSLVFDKEVLEWVTEALRQSHTDEKQYHDEAIGRLQAEYNRLQNRIDAMYVDKLDGQVAVNFFDRKSTEWRVEQDRLLQSIEEHQHANRTYIDEGVRLLELASRAAELFQRQEPHEKRRLLNFVLSNCTWKAGELTAEFRQPFDIISVFNTDHKKQKAAGIASNGLSASKLLG